MQKMKEGNPVGVLMPNEIQATAGEQHRDENPLTWLPRSAEGALV